MDSILTGELSQESGKEQGEKYKANEEICDLLTWKKRAVGLAFQRAQEQIMHGLSSVRIPTHWLAKNIQSVKNTNVREIF